METMTINKKSMLLLNKLHLKRYKLLPLLKLFRKKNFPLKQAKK
ncbi:hypothetical protein GALL_125360 [mine drainage metagenome]|uniref:Uncharacterized protein n=1 Tax=mine drainage metagenome TaxID=410659 RepID=A0A1J5SV51_9ZZZZ